MSLSLYLAIIKLRFDFLLACLLCICADKPNKGLKQRSFLRNSAARCTLAKYLYVIKCSSKTKYSSSLPGGVMYHLLPLRAFLSEWLKISNTISHLSMSRWDPSSLACSMSSVSRRWGVLITDEIWTDLFEWVLNMECLPARMGMTKHHLKRHQWSWMRRRYVEMPHTCLPQPLLFGVPVSCIRLK